MKRIVATLSMTLTLAPFGADAGAGADAAPRPVVQLLQTHSLPGVRGQSMTSVRVTFPPGLRDAAHHHVGSIFVYVLSGSMRTAFGSARATVLHAGQSFFEAAGSHHRVAENASATEPLRILVTTVGPPNAPAATYDTMK